MKFYKIVSDKIITTGGVEYVNSSSVVPVISTQIASSSGAIITSAVSSASTKVITEAVTTGGTSGALVKTDTNGKLNSSLLPSIAINDFLGSFPDWNKAYNDCTTGSNPGHYENGDTLIISPPSGWVISGLDDTAGNGTYTPTNTANLWSNSNGWTLELREITEGSYSWILCSDNDAEIGSAANSPDATSLTFIDYNSETICTGTKQSESSIVYICVDYSTPSSASDFQNQFVPLNDNTGNLSLDSFVQGSNVNLNKNTTNNTITISVPLAANNVPGVVKPDGTTIVVDNDGTMRATAQSPSWTKLSLSISTLTSGWSRTTSGTDYVYSCGTPNEVFIRDASGNIINPSELIITDGATQFILPTTASEISAGSFIFRPIIGLSTN